METGWTKQNGLVTNTDLESYNVDSLSLEMTSLCYVTIRKL